MKQGAALQKVMRAYLGTQFVWTFWFLLIMIGVNIFHMVRSVLLDTNVDSYYHAVYIAANIYMFVIGIITVYFLPYFVEKGVTRKAYFKGTFASGVGLSVLIPLVSYIVSLIIEFISNRFFNITYHEPMFNVVDLATGDGHIVGDIIQALILTPYVDPQSNWLLAMFIFTLNILAFYIIGWFISVCFYRLHVVIGLGGILIGVILLILKDALLRMALELPISETFLFVDVISPLIGTLGIIIIYIFPIWMVHLLTRNVPIKI